MDLHEPTEFTNTFTPSACFWTHYLFSLITKRNTSAHTSSPMARRAVAPPPTSMKINWQWLSESIIWCNQYTLAPENPCLSRHHLLPVARHENWNTNTLSSFTLIHTSSQCPMLISYFWRIICNKNHVPYGLGRSPSNLYPRLAADPPPQTPHRLDLPHESQSIHTIQILLPHSPWSKCFILICRC